MEINPYDARLRMLQQVDGVQLQREAAPDAETAGCPGCPYFWTCPVPHRGEEVRAPDQVAIEEMSEQLTSRGPYRPRDESDVGWTDEWVETDEHEETDELGDPEDTAPEPGAPSERRRGLRGLFRRGR